MPNWCSTEIYIHSKDKTKVDHLKERLDEAYRKVGITWRDVLTSLKVDNSAISCRGEITFSSDCCYNPIIHEYYICIDSEDAWVPSADKVIPLIIEALGYTGVMGYCYLAVESGMGLYVNTDKNWFPYDYYVDAEVSTPYGEFYGEYRLNAKETIKVINKLFHTDYALTDNLVEINGIIDSKLTGTFYEEHIENEGYYLTIGQFMEELY